MTLYVPDNPDNYSRISLPDVLQKSVLYDHKNQENSRLREKQIQYNPSKRLINIQRTSHQSGEPILLSSTTVTSHGEAKL